MSRFHKGQRVRIKWSAQWPELAGTTGTVMSDARDVDQILASATGMTAWTGYDVAPDAWGSVREPGGFWSFCPLAEQLEPATDSYDVTTWDSCVWRPEHLRVGV